MPKYKEYFKRMVEENKELFDKFAKVHTDYGLDEEAHQEEFNKVGADVLKTVHEWENRLCSHSEKAGFSNYTGNLAEKFQQEVKNHFPLIDHIGIIIKKSLPIKLRLNRRKSGFSLKKINL